MVISFFSLPLLASLLVPPNEHQSENEKSENKTKCIRTAMIFAIQAWLNETPAQLAGGKQPAYFGVGMSLMSLGFVCPSSLSRSPIS